jgi:hypothetical protein
MLAVDVSDAALSIAKKNSKSLNAEIELIKADFLNPALRQNFRLWIFLSAIHHIFQIGWKYNVARRRQS